MTGNGLSLSAEATVHLCEVIASLQQQLNASKPTMLGAVRTTDVENLSNEARISLRNGLYNAFNTFLQDSVKPGGQAVSSGQTMWTTTKTLSNTLVWVFESAGIADVSTWKPVGTPAPQNQVLNPSLPMLAQIRATIECLKSYDDTTEIIATGHAVLEYLDGRK